MERKKIVEILDVVRVSKINTEKLLGFAIDSPRKGEVENNETIQVSGWVLGKQSQAVAVELVSGIKVIKTIPINQIRQDVTKIHKISGTEKCGFVNSVNLKQILPNNEIWIKAVLEDQSVVSIGLIKIAQNPEQSQEIEIKGQPKPSRDWLQKVKADLGGWPKAKLPQAGEEEKTRVAGVSLVKDEADIIYYNLVWHYSIGIKRFVILNNMSRDGTGKEIRRFANDYPEAMVYLIEDRERGHYQGRKMTAAAEFAHRMWQAEWILPFDGDEILCPLQVTLDTTLAAISKEHKFIGLPYRNHILREFYDDSEPNPLKRITHRVKNDIPDHKVLIRWKRGMVIGEGNHKVHDGGLLPVTLSGKEVGILMRHYRFRSQEHIKRKLINMKEGFNAATELRMGPLHSKWNKEYKEKGKNFFEEFYQNELNDHKNAVDDPAVISI
ncbi:MAG: glycosyltransferase family 2 protein [Gomphosphaeria aponina SAG 52.96 = DSM 107014]|uniref:Glycosyltransferase family 2 protein n=1 Tax=Gomphosphaeria aponina SAG 52.96 = DSM 107014 TaxID=1521640 RepID=A0A941GQG8_9CHRO|nr:glycosyltransferase family 2 protein [Gomphosphaeria aponina SAG 52.96 = DSM 107014]